MKKTFLNLRKMGFVLLAASSMLAFSCGGEEAADDAAETATEAVEDATEAVEEATEDATEAVEEAVEGACEGGACEGGACEGGDDHACDHGE